MSVLQIFTLKQRNRDLRDRVAELEQQNALLSEKVNRYENLAAEHRNNLVKVTSCLNQSNEEKMFFKRQLDIFF